MGLVEEWEGKDNDLDLGSLDLVEEREAMVSLLLGGSEVEVYPRSGPLHLAEELLLLEEMVCVIFLKGLQWFKFLLQESFVESNHFVYRMFDTSHASLLFDDINLIGAISVFFVVSLDHVALIVGVLVAHLSLFAAAHEL